MDLIVICRFLKSIFINNWNALYMCFSSFVLFWFDLFQVWAVNIINKMKDIELQARLLLKYPEAIPPKFQWVPFDIQLCKIQLQCLNISEYL